jgi:hypothetical protein
MPYEATDRAQLAYHAQRYGSLIEDTELAQADRVASYMLAIVWSCGVAGVGDTPHSPSYNSYTSTSPKHMTVPNAFTPTTQPVTKKMVGAFKNRTDRTEKITNGKVRDTAEHWLRNRAMRQLDIQLDCVAAAYVGDTWYFASNNLVIVASDVAKVFHELGTPFAKNCRVWDPTPNVHAEMKILKYLRSRGISLHGIRMGVSKPCCPSCKKILDTHDVVYTSFHNTVVAEDRWEAPF